MERAGANSHRQGLDWSDEGTFLVALDLDGNRSNSAHDAPTVGRAKSCELAESLAPKWAGCDWVGVETIGINSHAAEPWCPDGTYLTAFDLDGDSSLSAHDSPIVGQARCCSAVGRPQVSDFEQPFYGLKKQGSDEQPKEVTLIVIAWQPKGKGEPTLSLEELEELYFGESNSVADWFNENSQGRYKLVPHPKRPVIGPFESVYDWPFYWRSGVEYVRNRLCGSGETSCEAWEDNPYKIPTDPNDPRYYEKDDRVYYLDDEGYIDGHRHSWAEAIRFAEADIDFAECDKDKDGRVSPDECVITIVKADNGAFGTRRPVSGSDVPFRQLIVDGVVIDIVNELYGGPPHSLQEFSIAIEEALHVAANLDDQYPDNIYRLRNDLRRPQQLALTDTGYRPVHIDPFHKLKWGWLNPQIVHQTGCYTLRDTATTGDALILYSPSLIEKEFFILENRWRGTSYDHYRSDNYGEGLALWHVVQDSDLRSNWSRRAVHLRRADPTLTANGTIQENLTLFDASESNRRTALSDTSTPQHLRFRNDIASQLQIRNVSRASASMHIEVLVGEENRDIVRSPCLKINPVRPEQPLTTTQ